jgi:hypothetical protein
MYPSSFSGKKYLCVSMCWHANKSIVWQVSMPPIRMNVMNHEDDNEKEKGPFGFTM